MNMGIAERITDKIINDHHIIVENRLCSRFRTSKSNCMMCAELCPVDAISISDKGAEIKERCIDCGVCFSVCPNGVFSIKEKNDEKIINETKDRFKEQVPRVFTISCERGNQSVDLALPCLSRLTEILLLKLLRIGVLCINVLRPQCKDCPNAKASPHINRVINRVLLLYDMFGIEKDRLIMKRIPIQPLSKKKEKSVSRREFLTAFRTKVVEVAADSLPEIGINEEKDKEGQRFLEILSKRPENLKRRLLIHALGGLPSTKELYMPSEEAILAEIEVSSKCTACGVCATLCPTGALTQEWIDNQFCLNFKPSLCTNCRVCVETCMPEAIRIKETALLNHLMDDKEIKVFDAKRKTCPVCQMNFIGGDSDICPLCINRHNKQMTFIKGMFEDHRGYYE